MAFRCVCYQYRLVKQQTLKEKRICIKLCFNVEKQAYETHEMLIQAFREWPWIEHKPLNGIQISKAAKLWLRIVNICQVGQIKTWKYFMKSSTRVVNCEQVFVTLPKPRNVSFAPSIYQSGAKIMFKKKKTRDVFFVMGTYTHFARFLKREKWEEMNRTGGKIEVIKNYEIFGLKISASVISH
jgi:hypothetical protein